MVRSISQLYRPFKLDIPSSTYTIDAGVTMVLRSFAGPGTANIVIHGDGDPTITVQIMYDNRVDEVKADELRLISISFNRVARIALRNPGTAQITAKGPTIEVNGIVKE